MPKAFEHVDGVPPQDTFLRIFVDVGIGNGADVSAEIKVKSVRAAQNLLDRHGFDHGLDRREGGGHERSTRALVDVRTVLHNIGEARSCMSDDESKLRIGCGPAFETLARTPAVMEHWPVVAPGEIEDRAPVNTVFRNSLVLRYELDSARPAFQAPVEQRSPVVRESCVEESQREDSPVGCICSIVLEVVANPRITGDREWKGHNLVNPVAVHTRENVGGSASRYVVVLRRRTEVGVHIDDRNVVEGVAVANPFENCLGSALGVHSRPP